MLRAITGCGQCPARLLDHALLPVSYFGRLASANAWVVAINPSTREFVDRSGRPLRGSLQRLADLASLNGPTTRAEVVGEPLDLALEWQDHYFERAPYRPYFNRLGAFLTTLHTSGGAFSPLRPFTDGVGRSLLFRYAHLDVVKCATHHPWSDLSKDERSLLIDNCARFLSLQVLQAPALDLIAINGRTACCVVVNALSSQFSTDLAHERIDIGGGLSADLMVGEICAPARSVRILGWSPNVVNQRMTCSQIDALSQQIVQRCPWLRAQ